MNKSFLPILIMCLTIMPAFADTAAKKDAKMATTVAAKKDAKPEKTKPKYKSWSEVSFIDKSDNYFDLSEFLINMHGFVPVPVIITEPAVGGFGGGVFPIFIQPNPPIEKDGQKYPVSPDMTMIGAAITINGTWVVGGGRVGTIADYGLKYKVFGAYADANIDFYTPQESVIPDKKVSFNVRAIPVYLYLSKQLFDPRFSVGIDYVFSYMDLKPKFDDPHIPSSWEQDFRQNLSMPGIALEFDTRDNVFTPNHGTKVNIHARFSDQIFGSDTNFQKLEQAMYWYYPITDSWVNALRIDTQQIFDNPSFYSKPFVEIRGVPAARYQGNYTALAELEERYDFGKTKRWSIVAFGGVGKAFDEFDEFADNKLVYGYGAGFRYLIAKKLGLRMGIDIAMGPDGPAWYIVFGNAWGHQ